MSTISCRDCGSILPTSARGCPTCALNLEIERKIDRILWRVVAPLVLLLALAAISIVYVMW